MLRDQGNLAAALDAYKASLAMPRRLAKADPGNAGWQRDLSRVAQQDRRRAARPGQSAAALEGYNASLAIAERLAKADPGNAGWQRDLSVSHNNDRRRAAGPGHLAAALDVIGLARHPRALPRPTLAMPAGSMSLALSHGRIGDVLRKQGNLPPALDANGLARHHRASGQSRPWQCRLAAPPVGVA